MVHGVEKNQIIKILISQDPNHRIRLTCRTVDLEPCGPLGRDSPIWKDYLIGKGAQGKKFDFVRSITDHMSMTNDLISDI